MSDLDLDLDDETDTSCGEEQMVADWEVKKEWLESILSEYHKGKAVEILNFEVNPGCTNNESVLSTITKVTTTYLLAMTSKKPMDKCKVDMIIKQLPKDPFSRFFVTEGQFDLREIKFYTQVVPDLREFNLRKTELLSNWTDDSLPVPMCLHGRYSPAGGTDDSPVPPESILVLSDLSSMDYKSVKFSEGLTYHEAKAALEAIANVHAHSLALKVVEGVSLPERYPFLFQTAKATDSYQQLVERGLPQLARFLKSRPGLEAILETLLVLRPRTKDIISALLAPEGPLALITHTDFWSNNLFFIQKCEEINCQIIDWQMITYSRPTNDVALLLLSSVPTKLRRNHTKSLLNAYWNKLTSMCMGFGLDIPKELGYTREDLDKDYRKSQLLALLLCIGSVDVALGDPLTEQRLIDVLKDLYNDGILTDETIVATNEVNS
ncbi:hypothetical protein DMN91_002336 [Ooceraea biroi]|uniref:CHK kinase-like domain-containing protein n=1 Tax=Ooceraea biroi TaxID=2015173 RepID=A0A026W1T2_OOCBI|nr:uncharacterized protein LOC105285021 [Ooceraea biroi]EZA49014.1 hypothetical protein X777_12823 [Ooceraea biroi]RLU26170.1 hypothetical protein DMN91_002336 [Ooceraea biroi]